MKFVVYSCVFRLRSFKMSKINNPKVKRARAGKTIGLIFSIVMLLAAALCFYLQNYEHRKNTFNSVAFADAYNDERLDEDIYVYIEVEKEPYEIGHYDSDEQYYYVSDGYDLYIIRCSENQYENIKAEVEANGVYEVTGAICHLNDEVIETAIEIYNEGEEDPEEIIDREDFDNYFQGVALNVGASAESENGLFAIGLIIGLFGLLMFLFNIIRVAKYNKVLANLSDMDAQIIDQELESPQTVYIKGCKTYLTPRYIVSIGNYLAVIPYTDVLWAYKFTQRYYFMPVYTDIKVMTRDFKLNPIANMGLFTAGKDQMVAQIFSTIQYYNPQAQFGYTDQLRNYFNSLKKQPVNYVNPNLNAG